MEPGDLLKAAESVQFYDWPHQDVVAAVVRLGKTVYGHSPDGTYQRHVIVEDPGESRARDFPVSEGGYLAAEVADEPEVVDLVVCFRPPEEQMGIAQMAIDKKAQSFWVQPPAEASPIARVSTQRARMSFITGVDIREVAATL
jgi:hypothetical protein